MQTLPHKKGMVVKFQAWESKLKKHVSWKKEIKSFFVKSLNNGQNYSTTT